MGQVSEYEGTILGRIGYETEETVDAWNQGEQDFDHLPIALGLTARFAIDVTNGRLAFQRRTTISPSAFIGAFATLLDAGSPYLGWDVELAEEEETLDQFLARIDRLVRLSITLRPPNPNYKGRDFVRRMVAATGAELVRLVIEGENVSIDDELVRQAIDHVADGYGKATAVGERGSARLPWDSEKNRVAEEQIIPADPSTGEADPSALRVVARPPSSPVLRKPRRNMQ